MIYNILKILVFDGDVGVNIFLDPLKDFFRGNSFQHMWYMTVLIGIYFFVPCIIRFKEYVGDFVFSKVTYVLIFLSCCGFMTSKHTLYWDIGYLSYFIAWFMMGYVIRNQALSKKTIITSTVLAFVFISITIYLRYLQAVAGIGDGNLRYPLLGYCSPLVIVFSYFIFKAFCAMQYYERLLNKLRKVILRLSQLSFYIYLIHAGVWDIIEKTILRMVIRTSVDSRLMILVGGIVTFGISFILSVMCKKGLGVIKKEGSSG